MVKILLADDHAIIHSGLQIIIRNYISRSVVEHAWDGNSAFEKVKKNTYHLIILDINMPETDAVSLVTDILVFNPKARILMFSRNDEHIYARKFLKMGAMGYLSKNSPEIEITKAIGNILNNKRYISSSLLQSLTKDILDNRSSNPFLELSRREFEIVKHFLTGEFLTNISANLRLHTSTVATYKARILEKLNCKNMLETASLAQLHDISF